MPDTHPLEDVLCAAIEETDGDSVSIGQILDLYGSRSFGPIFTLLGLLTVVPPVGAIPGLPLVIGAVILLFSVQMLLGRDYVWVPEFIENLSIKKKKIEDAHDKSKGTLEKIDRMVSDRLTWATGKVAQYISAVLVSILALAMIPLDLVPFAVAVPGTAITLIGLALLARDGVLMILAFALSAAGMAVILATTPILSLMGLK